MKIKTRLTIAFFIIIMVPILLAFFTVAGSNYYQMKNLSSSLGVKGIDFKNEYNPVYAFPLVSANSYQLIDEMVSKDTAKLEDASYISGINDLLRKDSAFLVVAKQSTIVYNGCPSNKSETINKITDYLTSEKEDTAISPVSKGILLGGMHQILLQQTNVTFPDGVNGCVIVATDLGKAIPGLKGVMLNFIFSIIFILVVTSAILMLWIYKGIATPLAKLKEATQNIAEGNLEFQLAYNSKDEVGQLCVDFEKMRGRLKIQAEEKLQYDQQSKELISNISHDLKTPITAVKGYVEGIMDGVADTPEKMDKYIKTIYNKANEMNRLINELTFYSKIDTDRIPYAFTRLKVSKFFHDCIEEVKLDSESENIELTYSNYSDEAIQIIADAEQLRRVIYNIIGNSIKYMDKKKGCINVRVMDEGESIRVEIEDNGKGIAEKDLPFVFDRFYRTDTSRNSTKGGSGIGLSIVKKIIEGHGGEIWATSKENIGTVMYLKLRKYQEASTYE